MEPLVILIAFVAGLVFKKLGYPPMPGYLLAGFAAHALGLGEVELIAAIANIGLILLLFTIGLKLNIRDILMPQVWGVAVAQMVIAIPLTVVVIVLSGVLFPVMALQDLSSAWTLALALSFSSTVFAVKIFEDRGESSAFHAQIAIGILVIQDILAVTFLVINSGYLPSVWAILLLGLVVLRPALLWLLRAGRHGELVVLFGFGVALGAAELFEAAGLKGGLGALFLGVILSNSSQTKELARHMIELKDLFLVGFFLQIGYYGLPTGHMWLVALALSCLIFLRPVIYYALFIMTGLRARTSLLAGTALFNYSEFGLVVAAFAVADGLLSVEWLTTIALAVTISIFIATPFNTRVHRVYARYVDWFQKTERKERIDAEVPSDLGDADIVILGMGRVGQGAYLRLSEVLEHKLVGVEENLQKVEAHRAAGIHCVHGDAGDYDFWAHSGIRNKKLVLMSLTNHNENLMSLELARQTGFTGRLAVVSRFADEQEELEALDCVTFNLYGEAGGGFAEHVVGALDIKPA